MIPMTEEQKDAVNKKWNINNSGYDTVEAALNAAKIVFFGDGAIELPWCNMYLCIETNGHTHS